MLTYYDKSAILGWGIDMPRSARLKSNSGIYHVILRGINRQRIFEDAEDYDRFLFLLNHYREACDVELYAWCLMPNHVHLLLKEGKLPLSAYFRRLGTSFVYWYNLKYERVGHLFQDRYKSETVEDDAYFLTALRYIHLNPVKAGLCGKPEEYPYSSYRGYFENSNLGTEFVLGLLDKEEFARYHEENAADSCMDITEQPRCRITDAKAKEIMTALCGCESVSEFQQLAEDRKEKVLSALLHAGGSIRQVSRLTGASFGIVRKYI